LIVTNERGGAIIADRSFASASKISVNTVT
jgi:hypothetical protein